MKAAALLLCAAAVAGAQETPATEEDEAFEEIARLREITKKLHALNKRLADKAAPPPVKEALRQERAAQLDRADALAAAKPDDPKTQTNVGRAFMSVGENDRALARADDAVAAAEKSPDPAPAREARIFRAEVQLARKDYAAAARDARRVLEADPENKRALALLKLSEGRTGLAAAASRAPSPATAARAEAVPASGPAASTPRAAGGAAVAAGSVSTILAQAEQRLALDPSASAAAAERVLALDPESARAYALRARARLAMGDAAAAQRDADRAVALAPALAAAYALRAETARAAGLPRDAVMADLAKARELDASFAPVYEQMLARFSADDAARSATSARAAAAGAKAPEAARPSLLLGAAATGGILLGGLLYRRRRE